MSIREGGISPTSRRERFRSILAGERCVSPASVFDPVSARLATDIGFEAAMLAGSIASATILGAPDDVLITLTELAEQVHRITRVCDLPLLVDADHGYGTAGNVRRTVAELETAGVSALMLEDTVLPPPFGSSSTQLITLPEGIGKIEAAVAARTDEQLVIVARTSAIAVNGIDDAIARAHAYEAAGADALFFARLRTRAELDRIATEVTVPIMLGELTAELEDRDYLSSRGVRIALQGHHPFYAAVAAVEATLRALHDGTAPAALTGVAPTTLLKRAIRL
jgi:carboxyvinyl-carboxyphosphonate phosphorylmutase